MKIAGRCHCGNISFTLDWRPDPPAEILTRACGCSFCRKHGAAWTSCSSGSLEVLLFDPALVSPYSFGTNTAEFHVCARCGAMPVATSSIEGTVFAVVNANTFENVSPERLRSTAVSFDGEGKEDRLARRQRNWIGRVTLSSHQ